MINAGDLVKYMSRTVLVVDSNEDWIFGIELGSDVVGKYLKRVVRKIEQ